MSLVLTRMQNMRSSSRFDKFERRASRYGALDAFMVQSTDPTGIITPELRQKAEMSIGRTLEVPVIDYDGSISIGNTRTVTIPDSENTSRMVQITFSTYSWGFTITPSMYMNNEISIQRDFEAKMLKYIYAFAKLLDETALVVLDTEKTTVIKDPVGYTQSSGVINATWFERENLFGDLTAIMAGNDFFGQTHIVGTTGVESIMRKLQQHGLYNDVNKQNEFGDKIVHFTNNAVVGEGNFATGFAIQSGSIGMLHRFERDCLLRTVSGDGHEWDIANLPILNMPIGTYFYDSVGDYSAIAGAATADMTRTRKEHYGFAIDIAFVTAYNSDKANRPNPIIKFNVASADVCERFAVPTVNPCSE